MTITRVLFLLCLLFVGYSCADSDQTTSTEKLLKRSIDESSDSLNQKGRQDFKSHLIIRGLHKDWPSSQVAQTRIDWQKDTLNNRYSRVYQQMDSLIEGRPVFVDSLMENFFFYLPINRCWTMHTEYPDQKTIQYLSQSIGQDFAEMMLRKNHYRCGFEYGERDSWNLEKITFSREPWSDKKSLYQIQWIGEDPMPQLKQGWETKHKNELYQDWVEAWEAYKEDKTGKALFVPKPVDVDYENTLMGYFSDQYKVINTVYDSTYEVMSKKNVEWWSPRFMEVNKNGDTIVAAAYSQNREISSKTDTLLLPWHAGTRIQFGSDVGYYKEEQPLYSIMDDKMWDIGESYTFPKANTKYLLILLEFLYGDTYVMQRYYGASSFCERIYTMPNTQENEIERETGCSFHVEEKTIYFSCDMGGC